MIENAPLSNGRGPNGKFVQGWKGGKGGDKTATRVVKLRRALMRAVTPEQMAAMAVKMIELGLEGDVAATKLVWEYAIGKPVQPIDAQVRSINVSVEYCDYQRPAED